MIANEKLTQENNELFPYIAIVNELKINEARHRDMIRDKQEETTHLKAELFKFESNDRELQS